MSRVVSVVVALGLAAAACSSPPVETSRSSSAPLTIKHSRCTCDAKDWQAGECGALHAPNGVSFACVGGVARR